MRFILTIIKSTMANGEFAAIDQLSIHFRGDGMALTRPTLNADKPSATLDP